MKKLIAISITLVLFASAAFAETTVGGVIDGIWTTVSGTSEDKDLITSEFGMIGRIQLTATNEQGTFGGVVRVNPLGGLTGFSAWSGITGVPEAKIGSSYGWGWWQPISQAKLQIGFHEGWAGRSFVAGYGFHGEAADFVALKGYGVMRSGAFFSGLESGLDDDWGATLSLTPIEGLFIGLGVPADLNNSYRAIAGHENEAAAIYSHTVAQVGYTLNGIGSFAVSFAGGSGRYDPNRIFADFNLSAVENLAFSIGVNFGLPYTDAWGQLGAADTERMDHVKFGFGAAYTVNDAFGIKARFYMGLGGYTKPKNVDSTPTPYNVQFELMPYYALNDSAKVFLAVGGDIQTDTENSNGDNIREQKFDWWVNPYLALSQGPGTFFAGVQIYSVSTAQLLKKGWDSKVAFAVPVGIQYSF